MRLLADFQFTINQLQRKSDQDTRVSRNVSASKQLGSWLAEKENVQPDGPNR